MVHYKTSIFSSLGPVTYGLLLLRCWAEVMVMKRIGFGTVAFLLVVLLLLSTLPAQADIIRAITLSQPTGGEKVRAASEYSIRYTTSEATTDEPPPIPIPISV